MTQCRQTWPCALPTPLQLPFYGGKPVACNFGLRFPTGLGASDCGFEPGLQRNQPGICIGGKRNKPRFDSILPRKRRRLICQLAAKLIIRSITDYARFITFRNGSLIRGVFGDVRNFMGRM